MIERIYPGIKIDDADSADALAVAICHAMQNQIKIIDKGLTIMIVKLKGTIDGHSENHIDVDVRDIVYRILMTTSNVKIFKEVNSEVEVFIHEIIKEDARILVGFRKLKEREIFCNLLSVQGVGSKMALNIMSNLECDEIVSSIKTEEISKFVKISGVGQKLAKRIFNELREKISKEFEIVKPELSYNDNVIKDDLISCLINLGIPPGFVKQLP